MSARFRKITQTMMFLPYFISAVLVGLIVYNLLNFDFGFITNLMRNAGLPVPKVYSTPSAWPFLIVLVHLWQSTGYGSVVYFAAIMGIDAAIMEAGRVDGANGFQRIRYIIIPCLKPTFVILLLFAMGGIVRGNFGLFYNLVGANSLLFKTTDIIETFVYRSTLNTFNFSQGSAVGLFQSVVGFAIVLVCNAIVKRVEPDNALF
jgi:putative aldouronate transport system permease protein